jgi:signal transduction histidine kinase
MLPPGAVAYRRGVNRWSGHRRHRRAWHGVRGLTLAVALVQVLGTRLAAGGPLPGTAYLLLLAGPAALLLRRRWPVVTLLVAVGATVAYPLSGYPAGPFMLAGLAAVFSAVRLERRRAARGIAAAGVAAYVVFGRILADRVSIPADARPTVARMVAVAVGTLILLSIAEAIRVRAKEMRELARMRAEQEHARAEQRRRRASEERLRIARELHDVLGHHLSLINVQAGVGLHLWTAAPSRSGRR